MSDNYITNEATRIARSLANAYKIALENDDEDSGGTAPIRGLIEMLCKVEGDASRDSNLQFQSNTVEALDAEQKAWMSTNNNEDVTQTERYKNFEQKLKEIQEEIGKASENETIPANARIDPISKMPIKVPVMNRKCNHVYDKQTILATLAGKPIMRCPNMGCTNKRVTADDLVEMTREQMDDDQMDVTIDLN